MDVYKNIRNDRGVKFCEVCQVNISTGNFTRHKRRKIHLIKLRKILK
jgi:hypothetical protein